MTKEEKQLLFKDLCSRLPYGLKLQRDNVYDSSKKETELLTLKVLQDAEDYNSIELLNIRPYLRSLSSMTEEELRDFAKTKFENDALWEIVEFPKIECYKGFINVKCKNKNNGNTWTFQVNTRTPLETYWGIDWLNAHYFDYRGLIPMGLALEALEDMYKIES